MHLKQPCEPFTKNKERIQKSKETGDTKYIYKNELDNACFQHDVSYGDFKDLAKRTSWDKVLRDWAFKIAGNPKYDGYRRDLSFMVYKFFDKNSASLTDKSAAGIKNDITQNQQLDEALHKPIIRKFKKRGVYLSFKNNIWGCWFSWYPINK